MPRTRKPAAQRRSRVARLTRRGWILLSAGIAAIVAAYSSGRSELLPLGALLVLLPISGWVFVRVRPLRFAVIREFSPAIVASGKVSAVQLDVQNLSGYRSPAGYWRDTWPWRPFATIPVELGGLAARGIHYRATGSVARLKYEVQASRRGLFEIGPLLVDFTDPFGLVDGAVIAAGLDTLIVTPAIVPLPEGAVAIAADEGPTHMRQRRSYGGEDDLMTREYREGDAMRRVHWRASAHHGELMVRQEEQRSHAEAHIVLDTRRSNYRDARSIHSAEEPESETFEWAIGFCASLSLYLLERGFIVRVVETGAKQLAPAEQLDEFLHSLAAVQLTVQPEERMSLLHHVSRPDRSQGSVFAIVSSADADSIDRLVTQRSSFDLAVAFVVDPWTSPVIEPLRAAGWLCVPVHPDDSIEDAWLAVGAQQESRRGSH